MSDLENNNEEEEYIYYDSMSKNGFISNENINRIRTENIGFISQNEINNIISSYEDECDYVDNDLINKLESHEYTCINCGKKTNQLKSLGQWDCFLDVSVYNVITSTKYEFRVRSDHIPPIFRTWKTNNIITFKKKTIEENKKLSHIKKITIFKDDKKGVLNVSNILRYDTKTSNNISYYISEFNDLKDAFLYIQNEYYVYNKFESLNKYKKRKPLFIPLNE